MSRRGTVKLWEIIISVWRHTEHLNNFFNKKCIASFFTRIHLAIRQCQVGMIKCILSYTVRPRISEAVGAVL